MNTLPVPEVKEVINQWHEQLLIQADEAPKSSQFWNQQPKKKAPIFTWDGGINFD